VDPFTAMQKLQRLRALMAGHTHWQEEQQILQLFEVRAGLIPLHLGSPA
jgi:hypothetical protein